jgi:hypothetical protein
MRKGSESSLEKEIESLVEKHNRAIPRASNKEDLLET